LEIETLFEHMLMELCASLSDTFFTPPNANQKKHCRKLNQATKREQEEKGSNSPLKKYFYNFLTK
jgi:hypothetical protein